MKTETEGWKHVFRGRCNGQQYANRRAGEPWKRLPPVPPELLMLGMVDLTAHFVKHQVDLLTARPLTHFGAQAKRAPSVGVGDVLRGKEEK